MGFHDIIIHEIFNDNYIGSDLYNADIKTIKQSKRPKIYIRPIDFLVKYWIIWDYNTNTGYIDLSRNYKRISKPKIATSIYIHQIMRNAIFKTNDLIELKNKYLKLVNKHEKNIN